MRAERIRRPAQLVLGLAVVLLLTACDSGRQRLDQRLDAHILAFGTVIDVSLYGVEQRRGRQAIALLEAELASMQRDWHAWKPGRLSSLNQGLAAGDAVTVEPDLLDMIERARGLSLRSDGLFNPAIGRLVRLWGFHSDNPELGSVPPAARIEALRASGPGMNDLVIAGRSVRSTNPDLLLDFGGFAKGYGIDLLIDRLRELGIDNAVINAGGDLRAIGSKGPDGWRIGVRHPRETRVMGFLETRNDAAVFTSGDYQRYFRAEGERQHHIIDPRTGRPARDTASVTVVHHSGAVADAAATALFVAGPDGWQALAGRLGVEEVLLVDTTGRYYLTEAMSARLKLVGELPTNGVIVTTP